MTDNKQEKKNNISVNILSSLESPVSSPFDIKNPRKESSCLCCFSKKDNNDIYSNLHPCEIERMTDLVRSLNITHVNKLYIISRVIKYIKDLKNRSKELKYYYNTFNTINVSGNVFLPALLTLSSSNNNYHLYCFWTGFGISLLTGFSTAISAFFQINKKFFLINKTRDEILHDFYTFISLSDIYREFKNHESAFYRFSKNVESIMSKMSRKEFSSGGSKTVSNNKK